MFSVTIGFQSFRADVKVAVYGIDAIGYSSLNGSIRVALFSPQSQALKLSAQFRLAFLEPIQYHKRIGGNVDVGWAFGIRTAFEVTPWIYPYLESDFQFGNLSFGDGSQIDLKGLMIIVGVRVFLTSSI